MNQCIMSKMNHQNQHQNSAILANGRVNVSLLEHEIHTELADDARNAAEDSMKKRAIHMSRDYDEFEKFVAVSQLKPVQSSDMKELFTTQSAAATRTRTHTRTSTAVALNSNTTQKKTRKNIHRYSAADLCDVSSKFGDSIRLGDDANPIHTAGSDDDGDGDGDDDVGTDIDVDINMNSCHDIIKEAMEKKQKSHNTKKKKMMMMKEKKKKHGKKRQSQSSLNPPRTRTRGIKHAMELSSQWRKWCTSPSLALTFLLLPMGACLEEDMKIHIDADADTDTNGNIDASTVREKLNVRFPEIQQTNDQSDGGRVQPYANFHLQPEDIVQLCRVEIEASIMEGILEALNLAICTDDEMIHSDVGSGSGLEADDLLLLPPPPSAPLSNFVYRWMQSISKCGRFSLNVDFLQTQKKDWVRCILDYLEKRLNDSKCEGFLYDHDNLLLLREAYNL